MTPREMAAILESITYKPGSIIGVDFNADRRFEFVLAISRNDLATGKPCFIKSVIDLGSADELEKMTPVEFLAELREAIIAAELHEVDEWLKLRGRHLINPHPPEREVTP